MNPLLALSIGFVAGLRALTALALTSLAACLGWLDATQSPLAFLGGPGVAVVLAVFAVAEIVADQHPRLPDRKAPVRLATHASCGAIAGGAIGASGGHFALGALLGALCAIAGTFTGVFARARVAAYFDDDRTAGFLESAAAIFLAFVIVVHVA